MDKYDDFDQTQRINYGRLIEASDDIYFLRDIIHSAIVKVGINLRRAQDAWGDGIFSEQLLERMRGFSESERVLDDVVLCLNTKIQEADFEDEEEN